jgi:hypothetical protein
VALFVALFLLRLATSAITNDDYLHLSTAQQVVLGAVPIRDFLDPGELLFYSTSAAAQLLLGRSVMSEVLLDTFFLSLGHMLVFVLASRAARSTTIGLLAAAFPIVIVSRLYSYPKTFLYAVALLLAWQYLDTRRRRLLVGLSLWTGLAFLFRHDHGAYIGVMAVVTLVLAHWGDRTALMRALATFAVPVSLVVLPFLVFVQFNGGIGFYVRSMLDTARGEYERTVGQVPPFAIDWDGWLPWPAPGPPGEADPNVTAWLYWVTVALPPVTLLLLAADWARRRRGDVLMWRGMDHEPAKLTCAAVLTLLMHTYLLRARSESAIADVSALTGVLGAWLIGRALFAGWMGVRRLGDPKRSWARAAAGMAAALLAVGVWTATAHYVRRTPGGDAMETFVRRAFQGINPLPERIERMRAMVPPFEEGDGEGARYLFSCVAESDRLLITSGYRPELYYAAGRGFAAGRLYYLKSLASAPEFKTFSLDRLRAERVPIVLVDPEDPEFGEEFQSLQQYVQQHYRHVGTVDFWNARFDVLVDSRITPTGAWTNGLPCFR